MNSFMLDSLLHNIKFVNTKRDGSNILKVKYCVKVAALMFNQKFFAGLNPGHWSVEVVFFDSGTLTPSLVSPLTSP